MTIQFIFKANQRNLRTDQVLPSVFTENLFTGSKRLYLIHNRGTKHVVFLRKVVGQDSYALYGHEWRGFLSDSRYSSVDTFHFIRQGVDEFYVTGYDNNGFECNGYDLRITGWRQKRCLVTMADTEESPVLPYQFLVNMDSNKVGVMVGGIRVSTVTQRRITLPENRSGHVLGGQGWHVLAVVENLEVGMSLVLTNLLDNTISLVAFDDDGYAKREKVERMQLSESRPYVKRDHEKDERLEHYCDWVDHEEEHDNESNVFYSAILAYNTDRKRLTIPSWFVKDYGMKKYHNALLCYESTLFYVDVDVEPHAERADNNTHLKFTANWREISEECDFEPNKMVRFKLIYDDVPDIMQTMDVNEPVNIPLFHIC